MSFSIGIHVNISVDGEPSQLSWTILTLNGYPNMWIFTYINQPTASLPKGDTLEAHLSIYSSNDYFTNVNVSLMIGYTVVM